MLLLVPLTLSAARRDSGGLRCTGSIPFLALSIALVYALSTDLDGLVWVESSTSSQSSLFSSFSLRQLLNPENLPQTEFMFSHAGWTVGMEYRSYSQDTGPIRSKRQSVDPDSTTARAAQGLTALALNLHQRSAIRAFNHVR